MKKIIAVKDEELKEFEEICKTLCDAIRAEFISANHTGMEYKINGASCKCSIEDIIKMVGGGKKEIDLFSNVWSVSNKKEMEEWEDICYRYSKKMGADKVLSVDNISCTLQFPDGKTVRYTMESMRDALVGKIFDDENETEIKKYFESLALI